MKIFGRDLTFNKAVDITKKRPEDSNVRHTIKFEQTIQRVRQDINKWRNAVRAAESFYFPSRHLLYQTYKDVVLDAHLSGAITQRVFNTTGSGWAICDADGNENEELTRLLDKMWFERFMNYSMESIFYGHSLIQFGDIVDDEFTDIELIPRQYVRPEKHLVIQTQASQIGVDYTEEPYKDWVVSVGDCRDLGLLMKASPLALWKKNTIGSWSEHAELFGSPIRVGKTNVRDAETRKNMEDMLENMGSAPWAVFDTDDNIEMIQTNGKDVSRIYDGLISLCNKEMSKLIIGQTMTLDEGSSRSQAEVHERSAKQIENMDKIFITNVVNKQLFPLLEIHGFKLKGYRFKFIEKEALSVEKQGEFDIKLLNHYHIDPAYIISKYGTPVEEKEVEIIEPIGPTNKEPKKAETSVNINDFIAEQAKKFSNLYK